MRIGLLKGMEDSFPRALSEVLEARGATMVPVVLSGCRHDVPVELDLVLDRISHEIPFFRSWLRRLCLASVPVINDPEVLASDDRLLDAAVAARLGLRVPKTVLLPPKDHAETVTTASLGNLAWPIPFEEHLEWVGTPAEVRPVSAPGWKHGTIVRDLSDLVALYDRSGRSTLILQERVEGRAHLRAIVFGGREVVLAPYDPAFVRYGAPDDLTVGPQLEQELVEKSAALAGALGYDLCAIEFTIKDEEIIPCNFVNAFPDFDRAILGPYWFRRVVEATADLIQARIDGRGTEPAPSTRRGLRARLSTLAEAPPSLPRPE